jgi:hypothetical protein
MSGDINRALLEHGSTESKVFTPMLHNLNVAQREFCNAVAALADEVISTPPGQFFTMREDLFEEAPLVPLAGPGASEAELRGAIDNISDKLVDCRRAGIALKNHTLAAMRCFWVANHTQGANWETVRQIQFCDGYNREHGDFDPEAAPLDSQKWAEKVAIAMKTIGQERGLSKDGTLLGPVCPGIIRGGGHGPNRRGAHNGHSRGRSAHSSYRRDSSARSTTSSRRGRGGGRRDGHSGGRSRQRADAGAGAPAAAAAPAAAPAGG